MSEKTREPPVVDLVGQRELAWVINSIYKSLDQLKGSNKQVPIEGYIEWMHDEILEHFRQTDDWKHAELYKFNAKMNINVSSQQDRRSYLESM